MNLTKVTVLTGSDGGSNSASAGVPLLNGKFLAGQYTYKIYHLQSKVRPTLEPSSQLYNTTMFRSPAGSKWWLRKVL